MWGLPEAWMHKASPRPAFLFSACYRQGFQNQETSYQLFVLYVIEPVYKYIIYIITIIQVLDYGLRYSYNN